MSGLHAKNRRTVTGDPLDDLLDDTPMKRANAKARPRIAESSSSGTVNVWLIATAASIIWTASVLAFSWARYSLPEDPRSVIGAAQSRIGFADWLIIAATITGPVLLIWVIAWLVRRSMDLRDESRRLARAAILLADAAKTAEKRAEAMLPAPDSIGGELIANGPVHFHREIERASHAMNALQSQMSSMEEALAKQSAVFDNAAERTRAMSRSNSAGAVLIAEEINTHSPSVKPVTKDSDADSLVVAATNNEKITAVDLSLEADNPVDQARQNLMAAQKSVTWNKLAPEQVSEPTLKRPSKSPLEEIRSDVAAIKAPHDLSTNSIDPFDDLGPSVPKAAAGATLGSGVAMAFGATRDEGDADVAPVKLGSPILSEPDPVPPKPQPTQSDNSAPKEEEFEFVQRALDWRKFVKAANFPENERDTETLDALYEVLTDPEAAALLQSSEDVLATLADLDLYMEDFVPEMSPISVWREHLEGKAGVQRIDAPIEQSRINLKLNADGAFQKLSERFVERYQTFLKRFFAEESDERLAIELADSRTGRAYILMADALGKL